MSKFKNGAMVVAGQELKVNPEFKKLIPPLTSEEYEQLEQNCIAEGIRDALCVWQSYIIDGHNRYEISQTYGLPFDTIEMDFDSEEDVKEWMITNQFGRRNLSAYQRSVLALELEEVFRAKAREKQATSTGGTNPQLVQNSGQAAINIQQKKEINEIWNNSNFDYDTKRRLSDNVNLKYGKERKKLNNRNNSYVYIAVSGDKLKVGLSINPESRIEQLRTGAPDIELIEKYPGNKEIEKDTHKKFKEYSVGGEWFLYSEDLLKRLRNYIEGKSKKINKVEYQLAKVAQVSHDTIAKVKKIQEKAPEETKAKLMTGEVSINQAYKEIKKKKKQEDLYKKKEEIKESLKKEIEKKPILYLSSFEDFLNTVENGSVDLLLTDPPYKTDVKDIDRFAEGWVKKALDKVKDTGRAFICTGAYPDEVFAYLSAFKKCPGFIVDNPLIWTYRNTLGITPKMKYNLNYQIIWHIYRDSSNELDTSITNEMFSVQDINAPDGRMGNRYHTWQKPNELAERLIRHATKPGDLVLDCFACTGTFSLMAAKLGRDSIGCDISRENLIIANDRGCDVKF